MTLLCKFHVFIILSGIEVQSNVPKKKRKKLLCVCFFSEYIYMEIIRGKKCILSFGIVIDPDEAQVHEHTTILLKF